MSHSPTLAWLLAGAALLGGQVREPLGPASGALEPFELALQADLVVEGVITDVERGRTGWFRLWEPPPVFELEVGEVLAGFVPGGAQTLEVEQLQGRAVAGRYAPYERGQRAVYFLRRPRGSGDPPWPGGPPWTVLGAAGEGECPVVADDPAGGDQVLFEGAGLERLQRVSTRAFGHHYYGFRRPRAEFHAMVRGLRRCYEWKPASGTAIPEGTSFPLQNLRRTCGEDELRAFTTSSDLARAVVRDARARAASRSAGGL